MDSLRWILLGIGALVVAGIYIYAQIAKQRRREPEPGYEQVDWEQDSVSGLSESDEEFYDDLPSMDALNSARAAHRAEGNSIAPSPVISAPEHFEDTQEIPVLQDIAESADIVEPEEKIEDKPAQVSPSLRNNLLLGAVPQEPVMGTPISHAELEAERPSPSMSTDSLAAAGLGRDEPSFTDLLGLESGQMAEALQRRRQQREPEDDFPKVKKPLQNAFSFDAGVTADSKLEQAANRRLQESSAQRVAAKTQVLKQQAEKKAQTISENTAVPVRSEQAQVHQSSPEQPVPAQGKPIRDNPDSSQVAQPQEEVVVLHVKATDSIGFYGPEMAQCFDDIGIKFGEMDIYHYQSGGQRLLSVANMMKPGTFDPNNLTGFTTPGISLFLQLRPESDFALSEQVLVKSAQYIAYKLKGEVLTAAHEALDNVRQAALSRDIADIKASFVS